MGSKSALLLLAAVVGGCAYTPHDLPDAGLAAVNVPVVNRVDYVFDAAAPGGTLAPSEAARLDGWFRSLELRYGDVVYVETPFGDAARAQVAGIAGQYGLLVTPGAPVTAGGVGPDNVRVIVSRTVASVPGCPNWSRASNPNYNNRNVPNFGCAVNSNLAAMVANPTDLVHGREGSSVVDAATGAKAIDMYRNWPLTAVVEGQTKRPLDQASTKKGEE